MGGQIKLAINKDFYFESQTIEGEIYLDARQAININDIKLSLKSMECFLFKESDNNIASEINNQIVQEQNVNIKQIMRVQSDNILLNAGSYKFPFKFILPPNLQPSFEFPSNSKSAYIRYLLSAELISSKLKAIASKYILIKSRPIVIQHDVRHDDEKNVWNIGIIPRGSCRIAVFTVSNNYRINDIMPITVDIYNENCKTDVKTVKISMKRNMTFVDKNKKNYCFSQTFYRENYEVNVPSGHKNSFHYDIQLRDSELKGFSYKKEMNPYQNLEDLNLLLPTLKSSLIACEYTIKVTAYFSVFTPHDCRPRVELPLFVTAQTIDDYKAEQRQNEIDGVKNNKSTFGNYSQIGQGNYGNNPNYNNNNNNIIVNDTNSKAGISDNQANNNNNKSKFSYEMYRQKAFQKNNNNNNINNNNFGNNNQLNNNNNFGNNNQFNNNNNYGNNNLFNNNNNYGNNAFGNQSFNPYLDNNQNQNYGTGNNQNQNMNNNIGFGSNISFGNPNNDNLFGNNYQNNNNQNPYNQNFGNQNWNNNNQYPNF